jgi:hypothetical protein
MQNEYFLKISKNEYEQIARALVVFDHLRHRTLARRNGAAKDMSDLQERWLAEGERFGYALSEEAQEKIMHDAFATIDGFLETETWHELAWWIAEREYTHLAADCGDDEARELVMDRMYHQVMEEFFRYGIDRVRVPNVPGDALAPKRVVHALKALRAQTAHLSRGEVSAQRPPRRRLR